MNRGTVGLHLDILAREIYLAYENQMSNPPFMATDLVLHESLIDLGDQVWIRQVSIYNRMSLDSTMGQHTGYLLAIAMLITLRPLKLKDRDQGVEYPLSVDNTFQSQLEITWLELEHQPTVMTPVLFHNNPELT